MVPYGQGQSFSTGAVFTSRSIENAFSLMAAQYLGSDLILLYIFLDLCHNRCKLPRPRDQTLPRAR